MVEYTVLRDYQTAVGLLLAATPERSARYYRDALCTLALAVRPWHVQSSTLKDPMGSGISSLACCR